MLSNSLFFNKPIKRLVLIIAFSALGLLLQSFAGSWDATSHLIKTPESFFTLPHIMLYTGIGFTIVAFVLSINFDRNLRTTIPEYRDIVKTEEKFEEEKEDWKFQRIKLSLRLLIAGTIILMSGAPLDFVWHGLFGNDGLLSPPHLVVITGMLIINIGAIIISYLLYDSNRNSKCVKGILISLFSTLWYISTWYVYFFTLPFSKGHSLNFNPDPMFAAIIVTICIPLVSSMIFVLVCKIFRKIGIASIVALIVVGINVLGSILPASNLIDSLAIIPVYVSLAIVPILIADFVANTSSNQRSQNKEKNNYNYIIFKNSNLFLLTGGGIIVDLTFYTFNFPMLTIVFIKFFGLSLAIDNLANNFVDSLILAGQYDVNKNFILIFTIVGAIMGALGAITLHVNSIYNNLRDISMVFKLSKHS